MGNNRSPMVAETTRGLPESDLEGPGTTYPTARVRLVGMAMAQGDVSNASASAWSFRQRAPSSELDRIYRRQPTTDGCQLRTSDTPGLVDT